MSHFVVYVSAAENAKSVGEGQQRSGLLHSGSYD